jgi:hypothetical protein
MCVCVAWRYLEITAMRVHRKTVREEAAGGYVGVGLLGRGSNTKNNVSRKKTRPKIRKIRKKTKSLRQQVFMFS